MGDGTQEEYDGKDHRMHATRMASIVGGAQKVEGHEVPGPVDFWVTVYRWKPGGIVRSRRAHHQRGVRGWELRSGLRLSESWHRGTGKPARHLNHLKVPTSQLFVVYMKQ